MCCVTCCISCLIRYHYRPAVVPRLLDHLAYLSTPSIAMTTYSPRGVEPARVGHMQKTSTTTRTKPGRPSDRARVAASQGSGPRTEGNALNSYNGECKLGLTIVISGLTGGCLQQWATAVIALRDLFETGKNDRLSRHQDSSLFPTSRRVHGGSGCWLACP